MALLSLKEYKNWATGRRLDYESGVLKQAPFPSWQPYQCWDNAAYYDYKHVSGTKGFPTGDGCAAGVYYNFPYLPKLTKYYKRIANTASNLPKPGNIIVWKYSTPGTGGCGHIAVVLSANFNGFYSLDQNWGGAYVHKVWHNWNYVAGWLSPK